jgi:hypothetical protein
VRDVAAPGKVTHRGATHIVKSFDPNEYPELAANEFICTRGAAAAGIDTPIVRLSENRRFLVVDRFDLAADGTYLCLEDFCALDARRSHGRYDGSYEAIARRMHDYLSPRALSRANEQFALMVAYSCAVGNGDAHRKNFSVLYRHPDDEVSLAPAYDIVSTLPYMPRDTLALELSGTKAFPDRARLLKFVRQAEVDQDLGVVGALLQAFLEPLGVGRRGKGARTDQEGLRRLVPLCGGRGGTRRRFQGWYGPSGLGDSKIALFILSGLPRVHLYLHPRRSRGGAFL